MDLFDVYSLFDVTPVSARGWMITDENGEEYLDLYGGHAVISIGHSHPHYIRRIKDQLDRMAFYSNSVRNPLQEELAAKLGEVSGCDTYQLFLCNSGAEANENALKLASFHTGRHRVLGFQNSFHGRTSAAVAVTDNPAIQAPLNSQHDVKLIPLNDLEALEQELALEDVCAVIIEAIQGVGGLDQPSTQFLNSLGELARKHGTLVIADEVQCGFGRSGKFFAFQHSELEPDIISMAKGMGNGFPVGGILIHPELKPRKGMLGTTFGGNQLACVAALSVLEVIEQEHLMENARKMESYFKKQTAGLRKLKRIKGSGLMLGLEFEFEVADLRKRLITEHKIFTGSSKNKHVLRVLPALSVSENELDNLVQALKKELT